MDHHGDVGETDAVSRDTDIVLESELDEGTTTYEHMARLVAKAGAISGDRAVKKAKANSPRSKRRGSDYVYDALIVPDTPQDDRSAAEDRLIAECDVMNDDGVECAADDAAIGNNEYGARSVGAVLPWTLLIGRVSNR